MNRMHVIRATAGAGLLRGAEDQEDAGDERADQDQRYCDERPSPESPLLGHDYPWAGRMRSASHGADASGRVRVTL